MRLSYAIDIQIWRVQGWRDLCVNFGAKKSARISVSAAWRTLNTSIKQFRIFIQQEIDTEFSVSQS